MAGDARAIADGMHDSDSKRTMLEIADSYDRLAVWAEETTAGGMECWAMPDRTAAYWEEKAARAIETASTASTTELRLAFLGIAKNYKEIAAHTFELDQWRQKS
jgi:hypothetical protein